MSLDSIPVEILERICIYLDTGDVLKLRSLIRGMHAISYRKVFKKVHLRSDWFIKRELFVSFFRTRFSECVTVFNITSIYWIKAADIRQCISAMVNLESLYAIDTQIDLSRQDLAVYNSLPKLKRLGISLSSRSILFNNDLFDPKNCPPVTHLYLYFHYSISTAVRLCLDVFCKKKTIEELWLVEGGLYNRNSGFIFSDPPRDEIKRYFISSANATSVLLNNKAKVFSTNQWGNQFYYDSAYPYRSALHSLEGLDESWLSLLTLRRHTCPFNFVQAKELFDGVQFNTMKFVEINLMHADIRCGDQHESLVAKVLVSDNMKNLKKLAINYCTCLARFLKTESKVSIFDPEPKRARLDEFSPTELPLLHRITENSPLIEELELWNCQRVVNNAKMLDAALEPIAKFKHLKRLLLDNIPLTISGNFLKTLCCECANLQSLSIKSAQQNSKLHISLCKVLRESLTNLKDFRYHHPAISYDRLFESLLNNEALKLKRLYIESRLVEEFIQDNLYNFLCKNPQVRFFQIIVNDMSLAKLKSLSSRLNEFRKGGWRVVSVDKETQNSINLVPLIYQHEMIRYGSRVSIIDTLHDYTTS